MAGIWGGLAGIGDLLWGGDQRDIAREGTLTDPTDRARAVSIQEAMREAEAAGGGFAAFLMQRYGIQPKGGADPTDQTLRVMVPGLNTPEPEASRRTGIYADVMGQPMVHLHNGTLLDTPLPGAEHLDYASAAMQRLGLRTTPLMTELERLLTAALSGAEPADVHAILYSDSTIGGTKAIARFRANEIRRRIQALPPARRRSARESVTAEVDQLLRDHLFVELHGNATGDIPPGPRTLVWTDDDDQMTHKPLPGGGQLGFDGKNQDPDANAVYIDYDGPFKGGDAHNLAAGGIHVVRATLEANGVETTEALWEKANRGEAIVVPQGVEGDPKELWDPKNR